MTISKSKCATDQ